MTRILSLLALLAIALAGSLFTAPAQAQRARVFVASYGNDSNPCTFGSPCKTFQGAYVAVAAGGEITAIDSAGFGPLTIGKAVTVTSPYGVEAGIVPTTNGNAITINAGPTDAIVLRGLTLDGTGAGTGTNGIVFNSGGSLTVTDCVVQNFSYNGSTVSTGNGVFVDTSSSGTRKFLFTDTSFLNNGNAGIFYIPIGSVTATIVIDHVTATANQTGIIVDTSSVSSATVNAAISNSVASANSGDGIYIEAGSGDLRVSIDNVSATGNGNGVHADNAPIVLLGRSVITGNTVGVANNTSGTFYSYNDNRVNLNYMNDVTTGLQPLPLK